jgi:ankyrin repeat protein
MEDGKIAWNYVAEKGHNQVRRELFLRGTYINQRSKDCQTPILRAVPLGFRTTVKLMIKHGAKWDARDNLGLNSLVRAAAMGNKSMAQQLLQEKVDINAGTKQYGRTALRAESEGGYLAVVERLLQEQANVNVAAVRHNGRTTLQATAKRGYLEVVGRLLQEQANVNAPATRHNGRTALAVV